MEHKHGIGKQLFCKPFCLVSRARWGVVEWIEHPLLMLQVRGLNPDHSISKNTTSLPEPKWLFRPRFLASFPELGVTRGSDQKRALLSNQYLTLFKLQLKNWIFTRWTSNAILFFYNFALPINCDFAFWCFCYALNNPGLTKVREVQRGFYGICDKERCSICFKGAYEFVSQLTNGQSGYKAQLITAQCCHIGTPRITLQSWYIDLSTLSSCDIQTIQV